MAGSIGPTGLIPGVATPDDLAAAAETFAEQAAAAPELWVRIDGDGDADLVEERVLRAVTDRWPELGPVPGAGE